MYTVNSSRKYGIRKIKIIITNKFRFFAFISVVLTFTALLFCSVQVMGNGPSHTKSYVIKQGDSLWSLASKYGNGYDNRIYVHLVKKLNNLDSSDIYPGMLIKLPHNGS